MGNSKRPTTSRRSGGKFPSEATSSVKSHSAVKDPMPARKPRPPDEKPQIERFREMARELGCDEDEDAFKAKLAQVMRHRPGAKVEPRKTPKEKD